MQRPVDQPVKDSTVLTGVIEKDGELQPQHQYDLRRLYLQQSAATPPVAPTSEDTATIDSVVQRMVEAVSYRAAADAQVKLVESAEAQQDAIWEAEFQAQEWRQQLLQQRKARTSSLQRCAPSRSISMPSASQQCTTHLTTDKSDLPATIPVDCSHFATAAHADTSDALPTVSEHCSEEHLKDTHLPLIRVPSSLSELNSSPTASGTALVSSRSSAASTSGSGGGAYVTPYMPPFGSSSKTGRQRRTSDVSLAATPALQTVLSLVAKVRSPLHASAMYKGGQARGRGRAQSNVSVAARVKAGQGVSSTCRSSSGKAIGDKGLMSQSSHAKVSSSPQRYRPKSVFQQDRQMCPCTAKHVSGPTVFVMLALFVTSNVIPHVSLITFNMSKATCFNPCGGKPAFSVCRVNMASLSRGQSLSADRGGSQNFTNSPMFWNSVPQPPLGHAGPQSSRSFFTQPTPSAILTAGAPLLLQKKITELVRRQNDTVKWEQKNGRNSEHREGLSLLQKSAVAVLGRSSVVL